jgi:predicted methyltransferase
MKAAKMLKLVAIFTIWSSTATIHAVPYDKEELIILEKLMVGDHRSAANIARNESRHSIETLGFFGLKSDMTLIEIGPSGGWYTEILAPYMRDHGHYYGAHFSPNSRNIQQRRSLENFEAKLGTSPDLYGKAIIRNLHPPHETAIGPEKGADIALTFRNVHNWMARGLEQDFFNAFYDNLKPGGILGVIEHRAPANSNKQYMIDSGYVSEAYVKQLADSAGLKFVESSEINSNKRDTKDHPEGVWTLPPNYRMGDIDRGKYAAIGESDRMTLKFIKPL